MTERYGLTSRSSVRKALTRAAKAQALQGALAELTQGLVSYLCVLLTPRHVLHTAALLPSCGKKWKFRHRRFRIIFRISQPYSRR